MDEVGGRTEGGGCLGLEERAVQPSEGEVTNPEVSVTHCPQSGKHRRLNSLMRLRKGVIVMVVFYTVR